MKAGILLKAWMGLSGLFLVMFLLVHLAGNLQLFLPRASAQPSFNAYSAALASSIVVKVAGWITYAAIALHAAVSAVLVRRHRNVRQAYELERRNTSSSWFARSMGWLGIVTLMFLVLHMQSFWYRYRWGDIGIDVNGNKDLYTVVVTAFREPGLVLVYVVSMLALGFHLQHGLAASLRSLGVFSARITRGAPVVATWVAWIVAGTFAAMPIYVFLVFGRHAS